MTMLTHYSTILVQEKATPLLQSLDSFEHSAPQSQESVQAQFVISIF